MRQMKHRPNPADLCSVCQHLRSATDVTPYSVSYHLLVIAARLVPEVPGGKTKLTSPKLVIRNDPPVTKAAEQPNLMLLVLPPRNINAFRGPCDLGIEVAVEQQVDRIEADSGVCVRRHYPGRSCAPNADILGVIFK